MYVKGEFMITDFRRFRKGGSELSIMMVMEILCIVFVIIIIFAVVLNMLQPKCTRPSQCDDKNSCTIDTCDTTSNCKHVAITACTNGDNCCPSSCAISSDSDCTS